MFAFYAMVSQLHKHCLHLFLHVQRSVYQCRITKGVMKSHLYFQRAEHEKKLLETRTEIMEMVCIHAFSL